MTGRTGSCPYRHPRTTSSSSSLSSTSSIPSSDRQQSRRSSWTLHHQQKPGWQDTTTKTITTTRPKDKPTRLNKTQSREMDSQQQTVMTESPPSSPLPLSFQKSSGTDIDSEDDHRQHSGRTTGAQHGRSSVSSTSSAGRPSTTASSTRSDSPRTRRTDAKNMSGKPTTDVGTRPRFSVSATNHSRPSTANPNSTPARSNTKTTSAVSTNATTPKSTRTSKCVKEGSQPRIVKSTTTTTVTRPTPEPIKIKSTSTRISASRAPTSITTTTTTTTRRVASTTITMTPPHEPGRRKQSATTANNTAPARVTPTSRERPSRRDNGPSVSRTSHGATSNDKMINSTHTETRAKNTTVLESSRKGDDIQHEKRPIVSSADSVEKKKALETDTEISTRTENISKILEIPPVTTSSPEPIKDTGNKHSSGATVEQDTNNAIDNESAVAQCSSISHSSLPTSTLQSNTHTIPMEPTTHTTPMEPAVHTTPIESTAHTAPMEPAAHTTLIELPAHTTLMEPPVHTTPIESTVAATSPTQDLSKSSVESNGSPQITKGFSILTAMESSLSRTPLVKSKDPVVMFNLMAFMKVRRDSKRLANGSYSESKNDNDQDADNDPSAHNNHNSIITNTIINNTHKSEAASKTSSPSPISYQDKKRFLEVQDRRRKEALRKSRATENISDTRSSLSTSAPASPPFLTTNHLKPCLLASSTTTNMTSILSPALTSTHPVPQPSLTKSLPESFPERLFKIGNSAKSPVPSPYYRARSRSPALPPSATSPSKLSTRAAMPTGPQIKVAERDLARLEDTPPTLNQDRPTDHHQCSRSSTFLEPTPWRQGQGYYSPELQSTPSSTLSQGSVHSTPISSCSPLQSESATQGEDVSYFFLPPRESCSQSQLVLEDCEFTGETITEDPESEQEPVQEEEPLQEEDYGSQYEYEPIIVQDISILSKRLANIRLMDSLCPTEQGRHSSSPPQQQQQHTMDSTRATQIHQLLIHLADQTDLEDERCSRTQSRSRFRSAGAAVAQEKPGLCKQILRDWVVRLDRVSDQVYKPHPGLKREVDKIRWQHNIPAHGINRASLQQKDERSWQ